MSTTFTMRIEDSQKALISEFAAIYEKSMADFMLGATLDVIEDAIDIRDWKAAKGLPLIIQGSGVIILETIGFFAIFKTLSLLY